MGKNTGFINPFRNANRSGKYHKSWNNTTTSPHDSIQKAGNTIENA